MKVPEIGQCVIIRSRPGIVRNCFSYGEDDERVLHLVDVEYIDGFEHPSEDKVVWEREIGATVFDAYDFPDLRNPQSRPDTPSRYHAFVDSMTWSSHGIFKVEDSKVDFFSSELMSTWYSAIKVEDYQLYPVLQAMSMPRVNILLADDVGLGKTIEAGLILQELIRKRRIRRMMVVCPASLQKQWQDEMHDKFSIEFTILDSEKVFETQKRHGMDANPWKVYPRIITSMDYLKQSDVLNRYINTSDQLTPQGSAMLPWDLLIVDEAHNFSPSRFADDSERCKMLRDISPYFEHRLFLTATPHNGYTLSFSGLLELLDPVRFNQKAELDFDDFQHLSLVMIRRMKSELNEGLEISRFPPRKVKGIPTFLDAEEERLYSALRSYRLEGISKIGSISNRERVLSQFIFSLLTKRLLSCSYSFARTWWRHLAGYELEEYGFDEADESRRRAETVVESDIEKEQRDHDAVRLGGSWLRNYREILKPYIDQVSNELLSIGWSSNVVNQEFKDDVDFPTDSKFESLFEWISEKLLDSDKFVTDERLIIFTEYKDTLDYLVERLRRRGIEKPVVQTLFGGASSKHRQLVKESFNDPLSPLRILVATDSAAEGLNLQTACRYVIHQEIPWNPMRLEQRNGRVDRHGQSREVFVYHFVSDQIEELEFLDFVVGKVDSVREDLGSVGKVFDEAIVEYFTKGKKNTERMSTQIDLVRSISDEKKDLDSLKKCSQEDYEKIYDDYKDKEDKIGYSEDRLARILSEALKLEDGLLSERDNGVYYIEKADPKWKTIIENSLLTENYAQPKIVFSPDRLITKDTGRELFVPRKDTRLLTLSHPLMKKAQATFTERLWVPTEESKITRWTVEQGDLPDDLDLLFDFVFRITVRNNLGERFETGIVHLYYSPEKESVLNIDDDPILDNFARVDDANLSKILPRIRSVWSSCHQFSMDKALEFSSIFSKYAEEKLGSGLSKQKKDYIKLFDERIKALDSYNSPKAIEKLQRELLKAKEKAIQQTFSEDLNCKNREEYEKLREKMDMAEWERQHNHVEVLKGKLEREKERIIDRVLPQRFSLASSGIDVLPVSVRVLVDGDL